MTSDSTNENIADQQQKKSEAQNSKNSLSNTGMMELLPFLLQQQLMKMVSPQAILQNQTKGDSL